MDMVTAASSQGFSQGGIRSSDWFSETLPRAQGAHLRPGCREPRREHPSAPYVGVQNLSMSLVGPKDWSTSERSVQREGRRCCTLTLQRPGPLSLSLKSNSGLSTSSDPNLGLLCPLDLNSAPPDS